tara:strand:+ start:250 stop:492 length:243 start_codon:yes stop_codon:yes gene_type:complete
MDARNFWRSIMLAKIKVFTLNALENEFGLRSKAYSRAFEAYKNQNDLFTVNGEKLSGNVFYEIIIEAHDESIGNVFKYED